jgi:hypothetical protein
LASNAAVGVPVTFTVDTFAKSVNGVQVLVQDIRSVYLAPHPPRGSVSVVSPPSR